MAEVSTARTGDTRAADPAGRDAPRQIALKANASAADNSPNRDRRVNKTLETAPPLAPAYTAPGAPQHSRKPLGALLIDAGLVDQPQVDAAVREGTETGERIGEVVVRRGWATEDDVARVLADQWSLSYVDRASIWFDADALARLSREDAQQLEALPVRVEGGRVMVAVAEPTEQRLADLRRVIGEDTVVVVVPRSALDAGIRSELLVSRSSVQTETRAPAPPPAAVAQAASAPDPPVLATLPPPSAPAAPEAPRAVAASEAVPAVEPPGLVRNAPSATSAAADLALQAHAVADAIAAQAAAIDDAARKLKEYERRIETLETDLGRGRAAVIEAKLQVAAVLELLESIELPA
jgi:hypothetical protein